MPLDPRAKALVAAAYRVGAPRMHELSVAQARRSLEKLLFVYRPDPLPVASVLDVPMMRPAALGGVLIGRLYRPLAGPDPKPLPVVIWFHGGGWMLGDLAGYDVFCRAMANRSGAAVFAVDYRLAPEHPFPAAVEDACFALDWVAAHGAELGLDPGRIGLAGDSAGGNLAAVAALSARDAGWPSVCHQLLIYPAVDQCSDRASHSLFGDGFFLDEATIAWFQSNYLADRSMYDDWRASPMLALHLAGLPTTHIVLAECDPLRDDGLAYASALREEGCEVTVDRVPGMIHGFIMLGKVFPQAEVSLTTAAAALRAAFANARTS